MPQHFTAGSASPSASCVQRARPLRAARIQVLRAEHPLAHGQQLGVIAARVEIYPTGVSGASISASAVPEPTTRHIPGRTSSDRAFMAFAMAPGHSV